MKRELELIEQDFKDIIKNEKPSYSRNKKLIELMNELEREYGTLIINPTEAQLNTRKVKLYRAVSDARVF